MRTTLLSIYKIALHVEPEDIVPVGLTHANMQKLKKVFHRYYSAGATQWLMQHQNWGKGWASPDHWNGLCCLLVLIPLSGPKSNFPLKVGVDLYCWDPNSKGRVLVSGISNAFVSGHRSRCGRCGSCETNINLGLATLVSCWNLAISSQDSPDIKWCKI